MRKLIELVHVSLGGEIGSPQDWAFLYLDNEHTQYATGLLAGADVLLLGRRTYEGLSADYTAMASTPFVDRMNSIPSTSRPGTSAWSGVRVDQGCRPGSSKCVGLYAAFAGRREARRQGA